MTEETTHKPLTKRFYDVLRRNPKKSLLLTSLTALTLGYQYNESIQAAADKEKDKKKVLVLPFYKMKIVEQGKPNRQLFQKINNPNSQTVEMPVDEVVQLIHKAAKDPNIVALYGIFGKGHQFQTGGWGHLEEIRNA